MLYHHLLVFIRKAKKFKTTFLINVIGLSTALACALLIYLWIDDEVKIDKFLNDEAVVFQVMEHTTTPAGIQTTLQTPQVLAEKITEDFPEIAHATVATPVQWFPKFVVIAEETSVKAPGKFGGRDFFNTFGIELLPGSAEHVLVNPDAVVICESLAAKLFGNVDHALGKTIEWKIPGMQNTTVVTGIYRDLPSSSSEKFEFVLAFDFLRKKLNLDMNAFDYGPSTFLTLRADADVNAFNQKIAGFIKQKDPAQANRKLFVTPYPDLYLFGTYENGVQTGGRITYVQFFGLVGVIILLIACINFMNLATAKATTDFKGVGVRKIVGAGQTTLIGQFLTESITISIVSLVVAIGWVAALIEPFSLLTGKNLVLATDLLLPFVAIALITGLLAGSYPAFYLSYCNPLTVLKGKITTNASEVILRKSLVVFQFTLSIIFIVGVTVVYRQVGFVQHKNLGFEKDNVIVFDPGPGTMQKVESLITEIKNTTGVSNASSMWGSLVTGGNNNETVTWEGAQIPFASMVVNYDFMETIGIRFKEGRPFSATNVSEIPEIIFNQKAIDVLALKDPLNKLITFQGQQFKIIGITENFHFQSLYSSVKPLFIRLQKDRSWTLVARIEKGKEKETLARLSEIYRQHSGGLAFEYHFLDRDFQQHYAAEERVSVLSKYSAVLAVIVSALGLFGLASFTTERKRKEIGIRKVLGATPASIVVFLTSNFLLLVVIAIAIGLPISYWLTNSWLSNFAYRIEIEYYYFILAAFVALSIACLSVGAQSLKASLINPSESLKHE